MMIQQIPQRLQEVNTLLATCKQDSITFEQALLLSLFYKDFNETNQIVTEAAAMFHDISTDGSNLCREMVKHSNFQNRLSASR